MKKFMKSLALFLSLVLVAGLFIGCSATDEVTTATKPEPTNSEYEFTVIDGTKTLESEITENNEINYYKVTLEEKCDFSLLAYNGNLEEYYNLDYKLYQDENLTECIFESTLRVTDTDVWGEYKTLEAGTYYITLSSEEEFSYYLTTDVLTVK